MQLSADMGGWPTSRGLFIPPRTLGAPGLPVLETWDTTNLRNRPVPTYNPAVEITATNGFTLTTSYILTPGNQQLTELSWSGGTAQWAHTNVWAAGQLLATYSGRWPGHWSPSVSMESVPRSSRFLR